MRVLVRRFWREERAQNLVEWALLVGLITVGSIAFLGGSSGSVSSIWNTANLTLQGQASQSAGSSGTSGGSSSGTSGSTSGSTSPSGGTSGSTGSGDTGSGSGDHHDRDDGNH